MRRLSQCLVLLTGLLIAICPSSVSLAARTARRWQASTDNSSIPTPVLALPGPLFASSLPNDSTATASSRFPYPHHLLIRGHPLLYEPSVSSSSSSADPSAHAVNTARHAWDAGFVLSKLLERYNSAANGDAPSLPAACEAGEDIDTAETHHQWLADELRLDGSSAVVELGAGAHVLPSLTAWLLGAGTVTATDVQEMGEWMHRTVDINQQYAADTDDPSSRRTLRVVPVDWTEQDERLLPVEPPPTLLLASDVVWLHELIPALVRTIGALLSGSRPCAVLYMAHQHRSAVGWQRFEMAAQQAALSVQAMHRCLQVEGYSSDKVDVYRIVRQAQ